VIQEKMPYVKGRCYAPHLLTLWNSTKEILNNERSRLA